MSSPSISPSSRYSSRALSCLPFSSVEVLVHENPELPVVGTGNLHWSINQLIDSAVTVIGNGLPILGIARYGGAWLLLP